MKKANPRHRWHLSDAEKQEIRRRALAGMRSTHIARQMRLNRNTVIKARKKMNLPATAILPEKKILALLKNRTEQRTIARTLKVPYRKVYAIALAHGFGRPRKQLSGAQSLQLIADILDRTASAAALAKKYECSYKLVLRTAHKLLMCERFLPSWRTPLTSYFPSRGPSPIKKSPPADTSEQVILLVDKICARFLNGALPTQANEDNFVKALSTIVIPNEGSPDLQGCPRDAVRKNFETHLHQAIGLLRTSQSAWTN